MALSGEYAYALRSVTSTDAPSAIVPTTNYAYVGDAASVLDIVKLQ